MMGMSARFQRAPCFLSTEDSPGFGSPECSRNPPGNSITAGWVAGRRERREIGFVMNAPNESRSIPLRGSGANPNDPAAFMIGLLKYKSRFICLVFRHCEEDALSDEAISSPYWRLLRREEQERGSE